MRKAISYLVLLITFLCVTQDLFSQKTVDYIKQFKTKDYPTSMFQIRYDSVNFLNYSILIVHVYNVSYPGIVDSTYTLRDSNYFDCRGWLFIKQGKKVIHTIYYSGLNAVGGCSGIYLPHVQPRKDYFLIVKYGDYDGNIIILDAYGNVTKEMGGSIEVSPDKRYLFSDYDSDLPGVTIYDFEKHKTLLTPDSLEIDSGLGEPQIGRWYYQDNKYIARVYTDAEEGEYPDTVHITIATYDTKKNKIVYSKKDKGFLKNSNLLPGSFDVSVFSDTTNRCNCGR